MTGVTIKQLGDKIRADLRTCQKNGDLPDHVGEYGAVRYGVRVSNSKKSGPVVNVTIEGVEPLIYGYPNLNGEIVSAWLKTDGEDLRGKVEAIRNRYNPSTPVYSGSTKFGAIMIAAEVTGVRTATGP